MTAAHKNIISVFLQAASANPDKAALVQDARAISYCALAEEVNATARHYLSKGIRQGDKVLVFVPMSLQLYRIVLALFHIGACPVFLDEWVSLNRLRECLKVVRCSAFIAPFSYRFLSLFIPPLRRSPVHITAGETALPGAILPPAEVANEDTALVTFTTGSTGVPKAANRTHAYLFGQLNALSPLLESIPGPCMTLLPIVVLLHLASGKTAILPPRRFKAKKPATAVHLATAIDEAKATALIASPAIVAALIRDKVLSSNEQLPAAFRRLESVMTGGGPVYPDLARRMLTAFPVAAITAVYGSTEAEPIAHISATELSRTTPDDLLAKGLPAGKPDDAAEVAILSLDANPEDIRDAFTLARNLALSDIPGEVIVAGDHVLKHYINNPDAEAQTKLHIDGRIWHRTGDCGRLDDAGKLYLLGRCSELFVWKGRAFYPSIITCYVQALTGISDSALLAGSGAPLLILEQHDAHLLPKVKIVLTALQLSDAVISFVRKIPKDPRHHTKTDYVQLASMLGLVTS